MHKFPKDANLRRQWVTFVQVKRAHLVEPTKHLVIHSIHFSLDCYEKSFMEEIGLRKQSWIQSVPQVQLNFLHHYHTNSPNLNRSHPKNYPQNYSNFSNPPENSLMESLLCNVCVPPLMSKQMAIVFTGSGFFLIKAVFLLSENEMSKINAKFIFFVAVFIK